MRRAIVGMTLLVVLAGCGGKSHTPPPTPTSTTKPPLTSLSKLPAAQESVAVALNSFPPYTLRKNMVIDLHQHSKTSDFVVRESYDAAGHLEVDQRFATGFQPTSRTVTGKSYTFQSKKWAAAAAPVTGVSLFPLNGPDAHTLGAAAKLIGTDQIDGQPAKHFRTVGLPGATMISADVWVDASGHLVQFKATASATATTIVTFSWGRTVPAISVPPLG